MTESDEPIRARDQSPAELAFQRRALAILEEVLDAEGAERTALLDTLCAGSQPLRDEVLALLSLDEDGRLRPIDGLPSVAGPASAPEPESGHRVGSYEILRPLGGGGMGRVFEALQSKPRRRVALKMLRFGLGSGSTRRRFEVESEILARLRHPAIAQVFEAGVHTEDSPTGLRETPYYALEFVEGARPIVEDVRARALDRASLLQLFVNVCDAIHHGHQRGVIHRDIKSANVLVGADGAPKVIDFGVARLTHPDERGLTGTSELVGTLSSMSPEQLAGDPEDVDLRCDVYALGVLLFELLCGRPPHDIRGLALHEASRRIVNDPPPSPRSLVPDLAVDLETILLEALAKEPEARYPTALDLAEDLRRYLRHEPIHARPVGQLRRTALFVRRHRLPVLMASAVALTLLITSITSMALARSRRAALQEADAMEAHLLDYSQEMTFDFLDRLEHEGVSTAARLSVVRTAVDRLRQLERQAGEDPEVRITLAHSYRRMGSLLGNPYVPNLGDQAGAEESYRHALTILEDLLASDTGNFDLRLDLANTILFLSDVEGPRDAPDPASPSIERALGISAELVAERPESPAAQRTHARALEAMGFSQHGDAQRLLDYLDEAERSYRRLMELVPEDASAVHEMATMLSSRGSARSVYGELGRALEDLRRADQLFERALELEPEHAFYLRERLKNVHSLLVTMRFANEPVEARLDLIEAHTDDLRALRMRDPDDVSLQRLHALLVAERGQALAGLGLGPEVHAALAELDTLMPELAGSQSEHWVAQMRRIADDLRRAFPLEE